MMGIVATLLNPSYVQRGVGSGYGDPRSFIGRPVAAGWTIGVHGTPYEPQRRRPAGSIFTRTAWVEARYPRLVGRWVSSRRFSTHPTFNAVAGADTVIRSVR